MDRVLATLACCFLALSFAVAQTVNMESTAIPPKSTTGSNLKPVTTTSSRTTSTVDTTVAPATEGTTDYPSTSLGPVTSSSSSSTVHTTQITSVPLTSSTSDTTSTQTHTTASTQSPTITTEEAGSTTVTDTSGTITPVTTPDTVSHSIPTTASENKGNKGLSISEKNMTIVFSVILGVFIVAVVVFALHKCKHKIQYFHQRLDNEDNTDGFMDDGDTLVISGGLYDGHPIYDNVPPPPSDRSQFRLDFLH